MVEAGREYVRQIEIKQTDHYETARRAKKGVPGLILHPPCTIDDTRRPPNDGTIDTTKRSHTTGGVESWLRSIGRGRGNAQDPRSTG